MPVQIDVQQLLILAFYDELLGIVYLLMQRLVGVLPLAIQIDPRKRSAIVAMNHSIRVQHRDNFDDELIPQLFCVRV